MRFPDDGPVPSNHGVDVVVVVDESGVVDIIVVSGVEISFRNE